MPLTLEIITPEKVVFNEKVARASFPTAEGEIQVLPGHIPLLGIIVPGAIRAVEECNRDHCIAIDQGFFQVLGDRVSLLVEAAVDVQRTDLSTIQEARTRAEKALQESRQQTTVDPAELEKLEATLRFTVMQELLKNKPHSTIPPQSTSV